MQNTLFYKTAYSNSLFYKNNLF